MPFVLCTYAADILWPATITVIITVHSHIFGAGTRYGDDTKYIEDTFGIKDTYVLMVKNNDMKKEKALVKELKKSDKILSITALSDMLGPMLPRDMIPNTIRKNWKVKITAVWCFPLAWIMKGKRHLRWLKK